LNFKRHLSETVKIRNAVGMGIIRELRDNPEPMMEMADLGKVQLIQCYDPG
jgi:hypothetical protein